MSWKVRHEGSPKHVEVPGLQQVVDGMQSGLWELTDEVMGPQDQAWVTIEDHPQLEEIAAEIEPPPPSQHPDETHLDFNALIDVCLVLLIFFMLTTTYALLQKMLDSPTLASEDASKGPPRVTREQVAERMLMMRVTMEKASPGMEKALPMIRIEGNTVAKEDLLIALQKARRSSGKVQIALEHEYDVPHGIIVAIEDAAHGAGIEKVNLVVPRKQP